MERHNLKSPNKSLAWCIAAGLLLVVLVCAPAAFGDAGAEQAGKYDPQVTTEQVTITKKMVDAVVTRFGVRFTIGDASLIVAEDGKQVAYDYFRVPCEVMLTYQTADDGTHFTHRIEVLHTLEGASNQIWGVSK